MDSQRLKDWIKGTPFEAPARFIYRAVSRSPQGAQPQPGHRSLVESNRLYDEQTSQVMARVVQANSTCVDVGCYVGSVLDEMLRFAPEGEHYAFEPLPNLFPALVKKYEGRRNIHLFDVALSDSSGQTSFQHVVSNPGYSGIRRRHYDRPNEEVVEIAVQLRRLDDVLPADLPVRLIKIDVEGAELQVMRGAQLTLKQWRPYVVFEHGVGAADYYGTRPETVFDLLDNCGLHVSLMSVWLIEGNSGAFSRADFVQEFDTHRNYYFLAHP